MKIKKILIVSIFFTVYAQYVYAQEGSKHTSLQSIEALYNAGSYVTAELEARRILESRKINDSVRVAVYKFIAFSLIAQGKTELAKEQFISLLKLEPGYDLDPVYTSPKILVVFRESRQNFLLSRKLYKDNGIEAALKNNNAVTYRTIIFPGWEQIHQNRTTAGRIFLGAGITTLGAGIVFEFLRSSARRNYLSETDPSEFNKKYDIYNRYYKAEVISFIAFAVIYIASEIDVLRAQNDLQFSFDSNSSVSQRTAFTFMIRF